MAFLLELWQQRNLNINVLQTSDFLSLFIYKIKLFDRRY